MIELMHLDLEMHMTDKDNICKMCLPIKDINKISQDQCSLRKIVISKSKSNMEVESNK